MPYFALKIWRYAESPYLCNVFFHSIRFKVNKKDWLSGIDSLFFVCMSTIVMSPSIISAR